MEVTCEGSLEVISVSNTMYIIMSIFTYTCSQKHNNLSDGVTM